MRVSHLLFGLGAIVCATGPAFSQALPRVAALYPPGARVGSTLDVAIRGGGLDGARQVLVDGPGLTATLNDSGVKVDPADQKVFTARCGMCHEVRGPGTISRTADQWVATVDRMIKEKGAPIESADREKIVRYVQAAARASAGLTARITVAPDATPGEREIRIVAANGTSTVFPFEITREVEGLDTEPNNTVDKAQPVKLPVTINGQMLGNSDADSFAFEAKKGERLVFNCSAYRMNRASQAFFFPVLYLFDQNGKELARNTGYFSLDPLIDWTAPEDGKYVVQVRDMLYRSSPSSVYRLSMGALPYNTHLYPAGGKRGSTTRVAVGGENMQPVALDVPIATGAGVGARHVPTRFGTFPFVAGDYDEFVETDDATAQAVTLPASINGRIMAESPDRITFNVTQEMLGSYTFDLYAERIDSPLVANLTLRNAKGQSVATGRGSSGARDPRIDYTFSQPGEYSLEVSDENGKASAAHIYRLSAGPSAPDFVVTASPDNPNLGPGTSVFVQVNVQRRVGITGDIEVTFPNLPPGVTASPVVIPRGRNDAFVVLSASPDTKPGTFAVIEPVATAKVDGRTLTREVLPYETYRINNNAQVAYRSNLVVTVGPEQGWKVSVTPSAMQMTPGGRAVEVTVKLDRNGIESDLPFAIVGLPQGVQGPRSILFKRGQTELTFTLTPSNNGIFAPQKPGDPASPNQFLFTLVNGREGEGMQMCSAAVAVQIATTLASR